MNLNTVGAFFACVLIAPYGNSAPVYTEAHAATEVITGQDAIVRVLSSSSRNQEFTAQAQGKLDLRGQVYFEVAAVDVGRVNTSGISNDAEELNKHSYAVFKTVSIPPPAQLLSPNKKPDRIKSNDPPADAIDITSEEFMLNNLTRSVVREVKQYQGDIESTPRVSAETASVLAVTNDDLVDPAQARKRAENKKLEAIQEAAPSQSTFLYVVLCKTGLMTPEKVGLSDDCD